VVIQTNVFLIALLANEKKTELKTAFLSKKHLLIRNTIAHVPELCKTPLLQYYFNIDVDRLKLVDESQLQGQRRR
jgi:hypothetical protein